MSKLTPMSFGKYQYCTSIGFDSWHKGELTWKVTLEYLKHLGFKGAECESEEAYKVYLELCKLSQTKLYKLLNGEET